MPMLSNSLHPCHPCYLLERRPYIVPCGLISHCVDQVKWQRDLHKALRKNAFARAAAASHSKNGVTISPAACEEHAKQGTLQTKLSLCVLHQVFQHPRHRRHPSPPGFSSRLACFKEDASDLVWQKNEELQ